MTLGYAAAGPQQDIVVPACRAGDTSQEAKAAAVGFLAHDVETFANCIVEALCLDEASRHHMAQQGRQRSLRFGADAFEEAWLNCTAALKLDRDAVAVRQKPQ